MKLCAQCRFFRSEFEPGGGCDTCGGDSYFELICDKDQFRRSIYDTSDFYCTIRLADKCKHFDPLTDEEIAKL